MLLNHFAAESGTLNDKFDLSTRTNGANLFGPNQLDVVSIKRIKSIV